MANLLRTRLSKKARDGFNKKRNVKTELETRSSDDTRVVDSVHSDGRVEHNSRSTKVPSKSGTGKRSKGKEPRVYSGQLQAGELSVESDVSDSERRNRKIEAKARRRSVTIKIEPDKPKKQFERLFKTAVNYADDKCYAITYMRGDDSETVFLDREQFYILDNELRPIDTTSFDQTEYSEEKINDIQDNVQEIDQESSNESDIPDLVTDPELDLVTIEDIPRIEELEHDNEYVIGTVHYIKSLCKDKICGHDYKITANETFELTEKNFKLLEKLLLIEGIVVLSEWNPELHGLDVHVGSSLVTEAVTDVKVVD